MQQRRYLKILILALFCVSLLLIGSWLPLAGRAPVASAHAFVIGSDPIDGSTINTPPGVVRIYFDAPIAASSQAAVYAFVPGSPSGLLVSTDHGSINATNPRELDIRLLAASKLPQGGYEVKWTALSLTDGHATDGLIGFNLGFSNTGVAGTPTLGPSTSNHFPQLTMQGALSIAWDWLVTLALLFWAGILFTETIILPRKVPTSFLLLARKHSRTFQALCLAGLLVGEVINLILRATSFTQMLGASGINSDALVQFAVNTSYGHFWLARVILIAAALLLLWWSGERQKQATSSPAAPRTRTSKRFGQLRQQARADASPEAAGSPTPVLPRTQPRVTGAVATHVSPTRSMASTQPRITALSEAPTEHLSFRQGTLLLILAGLIMISLVLSSEIIQLTPLHISAGLFSWLSLAAQAIWFGCIAYGGFTLLPLQATTKADQHAEMLIRILRCVKPFLLSAMAVLLVSELFLQEATLQTPGQLFADPYGRALLVRDMLLLLMALLTGYTLFQLLPRLQRQNTLLPVVASEMPARRARTFRLEKTEHTIRRTLHMLSALGAATLICVALMNFFAPPVVFPAVNYSVLVNQANTSTTPAATVSQTQSSGNLNVTLTVSPARAGTSNTVTLLLKDAQGTTINNATVKLTLNMQIMDMGTASATLNGGSASYTTTFKPDQAFSMAGVWVILVEVDQPNQQAAHLTFHVMVSE